MRQDIEKTTLNAFIWDYIGKFASHVISFIITIILTKLLLPKDFGLIAIVMIIIGVLGVFFDLGLGQAIIQRKKVLEIHKSSVFYFNIILSIFIFTALFISSEEIAIFFNQMELETIIKVSSLIVLFNAFGTIQKTLFVKELNYKTLSIITLIASSVGGAVGITMALNGFQIWSLVFQQLISQFMISALLWKFSNWRPEATFSINALRELWSYGFKMFLAGIISIISNRSDYIFIGKLFPINLLGYYQRAKTLEQTVVSYTSVSIINIFFPLISKIQKDLELVKETIEKSYIIISYLIFFIIGILFINSREIILVLFGENWLFVDNYFSILILSAFTPLVSLLITVISSLGRSDEFLKATIFNSIASIMNYPFIFIGIEYFLVSLIFS
ncbi:MAG: lipopolysaccharide biosynthesis protein, partial [Epsilonproteobacteria bacterium]|nr:lipopolysaccharide biosynthesis protein [Campylobacterota bacterium]